MSCTPIIKILDHRSVILRFLPSSFGFGIANEILQVSSGHHVDYSVCMSADVKFSGRELP